jgi:hypothetical protein
MRLILMTSVFLGSAAFADEAALEEICTLEGNSCTPFVGCIEATGEYFQGQSYGPDHGRLIAISSGGTVCHGSWKRMPPGIGLAEFFCTDGRSGASAYTYFDVESGTAVGQGNFMDGATIDFWAGHKLEDYFETVDPSERDRMACQPADMLLG